MYSKNEIEEEIQIEKKGINDVLTKEEKKELKKEVMEEIKKSEGESDDGIKETLSKEEKVTNFFNKIEFLSLDDKQKGEVALTVKNDAKGDKLYWIEIFLSSGIAALGLLQNSVAVIIGAMLIAPLLRPINGLSLTIARGGEKVFSVALRVLVLSIIASIFMGFMISLLVGFNNGTSEILARTSPNIIDFFIAIFSAMVAVMSLRFTRLGESIAGVAMAASLMPPLVVVGIELALLNFSLAFGAMMLFVTNLVAILIVGTIFFWLYGFTPHIEKQQKNMFKRFTFIVVSIIIILVPLYSSFNLIKEKYKISEQVYAYLDKTIGAEISIYKVSEVEVYSIDKNIIKLKSVIKLPENMDISGILEKIKLELPTLYSKNIELDIDIVRGVTISSLSK